VLVDVHYQPYQINTRFKYIKRFSNLILFYPKIRPAVYWMFALFSGNLP